MANGRVLASRIVGDRPASKMIACDRCGVERYKNYEKGRSNLCQDCFRSMSPEERTEWNTHDG